MSFTENRGQAAEGIRFYLRGNPFVVLRDEGIEIVLHQTDSAIPESLGSFAIRFEGSNRVRPVGIGELTMRSNFFLGSDPRWWATDVRSYEGILYPNLYEGIDAFFTPSKSGVKYEFRVGVGANPDSIIMAYGGASPTITRDGGLSIPTVAGEIRDSVPVATQGSTEVPCDFVMRASQSIGFACTGVEGSLPLVIDPLLYSTYFGDACQDEGRGVTHDRAGHPLMVGWTSCSVPTTPGAYDRSFGGHYDVFITKFDTVSRRIIFSTYLGGRGGEYPSGVDLDLMGNIYVAGITYSTDFPTTPGAYDRTQSGEFNFDGYLTKLAPSGSALLYSTLLGPGSILLGGLAVDASGSAYVTGWTGSTVGFPVTPGAFRTTGSGVFVVKMHPQGIGPVYGTLLGEGTGFDIQVDDRGNAFVVGYTGDVNFPVTPGAFDTSHNSYRSDPNGTSSAPDGFVTKVNPTGTGLVYSTFLGGDAWEWAGGVDIDTDGNAYVTGTTASSNFPTTPGAVQPGKNALDEAFVVKLNSTGSDVIYGTHLGGSLWDNAGRVVVDAMGRAHLTGATRSFDFPTTPDAYDRSHNGGIPVGDAYLTVLSPLGDQYEYSTFLGGSSVDYGTALALDGGDVLITGVTNSTDFPTTNNAFDRVGDVKQDAFLVKLSLTSGVPQSDLGLAPSDIEFDPEGPVPVGAPVTITATVWNGGDGDALQVRVRVHDGTPPTAPQIGPDELIMTMPGLGGSGTISVGWEAALPAGSHDICIAVDPDHQIAERDETNNVACLTLLVNALPPTTTLILGTPTYLAGDGTVCITSTTSLTLSPLDRSGLGIRSTRVRTDGEPWADYLGPFTLTGEGDRLVEWYSEDNSGSVEPVQSTFLRLDDTPPATFAVIGDPRYLLGGTFVTSSTRIELAAFDGGAAPVGLDSLEYRIDAGVWVPYGGPFTVSGGGAHVVEYRSHDLLGNAESVQSLALVVDDTPPVSTLTVGEPKSLRDDTFVTSATPFRLQATDAGVGTDSIEYRVDGVAWRTFTNPFPIAGDGRHTLEYRSRDLLGNTESIASVEVFVDDTPPTSSFALGEPHYLVGGTFVTSSTPIRLEAMDDGSAPSGVDAIEYQVDGGSWVSYFGPFTCTGEGAHTIEFRARDRLGNTEASRSAVVIVDDTPPSTEFVAGLPLFVGDELFVSSSTILSLEATDDGMVPVGVSIIEYRVDDSEWTAYSGPFVLVGSDGPRTVDFRAIDSLGNAGPSKARRVVLDNAPPVTVLSLPVGKTFVLEAIDSASGVAMTEYRIDNRDWTSYQGPVVLDEGNHLIRYRSQDRLANLEPERVHEVRFSASRVAAGQNFEPLVASLLAGVLVVGGIAFALRTATPGRRLKRFLATTAPFVGGEMAVGVASVFTASLFVPPVAGPAALLNLSILAAGLVLLWSKARGLRRATEDSPDA